LPVRPRLTVSRYVIFLDFEGFRYRGHEAIELESQENVRLDARGGEGNLRQGQRERG